jgi:hypothetical protein
MGRISARPFGRDQGLSCHALTAVAFVAWFSADFLHDPGTPPCAVCDVLDPVALHFAQDLETILITTMTPISKISRPPIPPKPPYLYQLEVLASKNDVAPQSTVRPSPAEVSDDDHIEDYEAFGRDLARAAARALKNLEKGRKYDRVLVLGLYWHAELTDRPHIADHAQKLLKVLHETYGYEIKALILEKETAYKDLNRKLVQIAVDLEAKDQENLFILYYGGHGGFDKSDSRARLWQASLRDAAEFVDWYKLQEQLRDCDFDILFLLDCCYAMAMPTQGLSWKRRCEVVGASGDREKAGGQAQHSFTAAVTALLEEDFKTIGETNAWRLGSIMKSRDYKAVLKSTPDHRRLSQGHDSTIPLVPLNPNTRSSESGVASSASSYTLADTLTCSDTRILFCIKTVNLPSAVEFERMLSQLPPSVVGVEVGIVSQKLLEGQGLFRSNSGLSLMSVPVWFW